MTPSVCLPVGAIANMCKRASAMAENLIWWAEGLSRAPAGGLRLKPCARDSIELKGRKMYWLPVNIPKMSKRAVCCVIGQRVNWE